MSNGWESYIAYGRCMNESKSHLIKIGNPLELGLHGVVAKVLGLHGRGSLLSTRYFISKIKELEPDIIHLHNIPGYYINYKLLFEFLIAYNKPVIWTLHDCWAFTGRCTHFIRNGCYKWKTGCHDCEYKKVYPNTWLFDHSKSEYKLKKKLFLAVPNLTIVPVSNWMAEFVEESFFRGKEIEVIHNGTNINVFHPNVEKVKKKGKFTILGVANQWGQQKGLMDFLELSSMLPKNEFEIILVGLSEEQLIKLPQGIKGIKRTNSVQELVDLYTLSDVFLNLTYVDNFPTVNIEALACGIPVITYQTGGSPEAISNDTGFVVEQGDLDGVLKAITKVKNKGSVCYMESCRLRAEAEFDMKKQFQKYIDLYERCHSL